MNKRKILLAPTAVLLFAHQAAAHNIVLILSDDQGWTGTSVRIDDRVADSVSDLYRTPSLERLAAEGMKFSNAYSPAPNCTISTWTYGNRPICHSSAIDRRVDAG